jgi:uncharacterized protein YuzE
LASLKYDPSSKALYVRIRAGKVAETEPLNDSVFMDLDRAGRLVGIEVILPKELSAEVTKKIVAAA